MRPALASVLALVLLALPACDSVRVAGAFGPDDHVVFTSGFVSIVEFATVRDDFGFLIDITLVTLVNRGFAQDLSFCGNVVRQFPLDRFVQLKFRPGFTCIDLFTVTVSASG